MKQVGRSVAAEIRFVCIHFADIVISREKRLMVPTCRYPDTAETWLQQSQCLQAWSWHPSGSVRSAGLLECPMNPAHLMLQLKK